MSCTPSACFTSCSALSAISLAAALLGGFYRDPRVIVAQRGAVRAIIRQSGRVSVTMPVPAMGHGSGVGLPPRSPPRLVARLHRSVRSTTPKGLHHADTLCDRDAG